MSEQFLSDSQKKVRTPQQASRLTYSDSNQAFLENIDLKGLSDNEVLIRTLYSGISRGTERLVYSGLVPKSEWQRMRCPHQTGEFSFPVTYGYACVGKVISVGSRATKADIGDYVFVLHPHQDQIIVEEDWVSVLPSDLYNQRVAVLSANMETALNANWDGNTENAKSIAIIGAGVVGLLTAFVAKELSGLTPIVVDIDPGKEAIVRKLGLDFSQPEAFMADKENRYECIFNTSASHLGLQLAIDKASFEGRIIEMSWYGEKDTPLKLGGAFHSQRLQIISSQVGHVAPQKRSTHTHADRMACALKFLSNPVLEELLNPIISFDELPDRIDEVLTSETTLCPLVTYS